MNFFDLHLLGALTIGFITGLFSGAFGIGGGTVSTPLLRLTMNVNPHVAVGTTMALIIPTSISAALAYFRKKEMDMYMGSVMVLPAVIGVLLGAALTTVINGTHLMLLFAAFVGVSGLDLSFGIMHRFFVKAPVEFAAGSVSKGSAKSQKRPLTLVIIGFLAGFIAGFFGVGGGFIFIPCMMYFFNTPIKTAFGTSLLVVAAISIPGTLAHSYVDQVDFPLMFSMVGGSIPGSIVGSTLALKLKDSWLRRGFGVIMLFVALMLAVNELF
ncbi:MAG: sulfite exporter TauE/SafE family protein [Candidatus Obscuribacterales bacterium]|nr:sulfite exporter TauE/SafE family protein [Candidatus Obscuribacterales bacterium]